MKDFEKIQKEMSSLRGQLRSLRDTCSKSHREGNDNPKSTYQLIKDETFEISFIKGYCGECGLKFTVFDNEPEFKELKKKTKGHIVMDPLGELWI